MPADIYRWRDASGVVHFSDREPLQGEVRRVEPVAPVLVPMNSNLEAAEAVTDSVGTTPSGDDDSRSADRRKEAHARRCERYRHQLDSVQSQLRAGYTNARGNRLREKRRTLNGKLGRECILR
jgi:hypothetical protein